MGWDGGTQVPRSLRLPCSLLADTLYFFGDNNFSEWASLFQHYSPPPFSLLGTTTAYSFGIAGGYFVKRIWKGREDYKLGYLSNCS